jgi:uncharacterized protein YkwD
MKRPCVAPRLALRPLVTSHAQTAHSVNGGSLSPLEGEVFQELNLARTRPQEYAAYLEQLRPYFKGKTYQAAGKPALVTEEGLPALEEAIRYLRAAKPLAPFTISKGMCMGAFEHVRDQGPRGQTGHKGTDGSFCEQRVARFGTWEQDIGEDISYGEDTPCERVITLLIDDGVANRGHRARIFNSTYKVAGVSCGGHTQLGSMCVITFAGGFLEKSADSAKAGAAPKAGATKQAGAGALKSLPDAKPTRF